MIFFILLIGFWFVMNNIVAKLHILGQMTKYSDCFLHLLHNDHTTVLRNSNGKLLAFILLDNLDTTI